MEIEIMFSKHKSIFIPFLLDKKWKMESQKYKIIKYMLYRIYGM